MQDRRALVPGVGRHVDRDGGMMAWWQQFVALCVGIAAVLGLLSVLGKWGHRMWSTSRKLNRLLDQLLGDREAGLPSLMDQLGDIRDEQDRQAAALADHVRWHGNPGAKPAGGGPTPTNGGGATARHRRRTP